MLGAPPTDRSAASIPPRAAPRATRLRSVRFVLPSPVSAAHAISVLLLGFVVEGATEGYQLLERGSLGQGWQEYYATLTTTILGFYLMFLGFREWYAFHPKPVRRKPVPWRLIQLFANAFLLIGLWVGLHSRRMRRKYLLPWMVGMVVALITVIVSTVMLDRAEAAPRRRRWPWIGLTLWVGGTAMVAVLSVGLGIGDANTAPLWVVWPVGGLIVLAFGSFFFGLRTLASTMGSPTGKILGWAAFTWSLGVATVAGLVVGDRAILLLTEFVTNWGALVASAAPIVVAMSPLFVTYGLMVGAFWPARHKPVGEIS